jgi:hypothetical protein
VSSVLDDLRPVLAEAAAAVAGDPARAAEVAAVAARLDGPLRLAIAGRVKAGKSTLLNALVGERLAPTDAGECTRVVTWFQEGLGYAVEAVTATGARQPLPFERLEGGGLRMGLGDLAVDRVERIVVEWPASTLRQVTLIDTPGLASLDDSTSARTRAFLSEDGTDGHGADAVIYLMRHLHKRDAEFLDAFQDRTLADVSPVNAIVVLSRADEIGAGRLDAMTSAQAIAGRYADDPRLRSLCAGVVAVAGLVAETGLTLREAEVAALRRLAALPDDELRGLLLSVDRFAAGDEARRVLLGRLGLFGIRFSLDRLRRQPDTTAADLARALVEVSGLGAVQEVVVTHFLPKSAVLKARSALASLRSIARQADPEAGRRIDAAVERFEASTHAFAELRLLHLLAAGAVAFSDDEVAEVRRVTAAAPPAERLGTADPAAAKTAALTGVERWRTRAANPLADPVLQDAAGIVARTYEGLYGALA